MLSLSDGEGSFEWLSWGICLFPGGQTSNWSPSDPWHPQFCYKVLGVPFFQLKNVSNKIDESKYLLIENQYISC